MYTRRRKHFVSLIALCIVAFAAWLPSTTALARSVAAAWSPGSAVAFGIICTTHDAHAPAPVPEMPAAHGHCVFCALGSPALFAPRVDALWAILDAPVVAQPLPRTDTLPRDAVAFHPLSPRAPPRAL